jgi:thiamine pyrophosphate-dependent acetolactate synthase large subunit-like protein
LGTSHLHLLSSEKKAVGDIKLFLTQAIRLLEKKRRKYPKRGNKKQQKKDKTDDQGTKEREKR